jgi:muramidase (phage lysozyme)
MEIVDHQMFDAYELGLARELTAAYRTPDGRVMGILGDGEDAQLVKLATATESRESANFFDHEVESPELYEPEFDLSFIPEFTSFDIRDNVTPRAHKRTARDVVLVDYLGFREGDSPLQQVLLEADTFVSNAKVTFGALKNLASGASDFVGENAQQIRRIAVPVVAGLAGIAIVAHGMPEQQPVAIEDNVDQAPLSGVAVELTASEIQLTVPGGSAKLQTIETIPAQIASVMDVPESTVHIAGDTVVISLPEDQRNSSINEKINDAADIVLPFVVIEAEPTTTVPAAAPPTSEPVETPSTTVPPEAPVAPVTPEAPVDPLQELHALQAKVVAELVKYHGISEDPNTPNHSDQIDDLFQRGLKGKNAEWCSSFVSRVLLDAGLPLDGGSKDGHKGEDWQLEFVNSVYQWAVANNATILDQGAIRGGATPNPGDLVIYNRDGKLGDSRMGKNHIGMVESFDAATNTVTTIEGNLENAVTRRSYVISDMLDIEKGKKLAGFIRVPALVEPVAEAPAPAPEAPTTTAPAEAQTPAERLGTAQSAVLDIIAEGEGVWDSINTGTSGDTSIGSDRYNQILGGRKLSELTIREVIELQKNDIILAAGRYQMIDGVLRHAAEALGMDQNRLFDAAAQNELAINHFIMGTKRPLIAKYIRGDDSISLEDVANQAAKEWASLPYHFKDGSYLSYYHGESGNAAKGGKERFELVMAAFKELRDAYQAAQ